MSVLVRRPLASSTIFPLTESPISEGGRWIDGGAYGLASIITAGGMAYGTQDGTITPPFYNDSTAALTPSTPAGVWGPNQYARAVVRSSNPQPGTPGTLFRELELRVRASFDPITRTFRAYGVNIRVEITGQRYLQVSRWLWTQAGGFAGSFAGAGPDPPADANNSIGGDFNPSQWDLVSLGNGYSFGLGVTGNVISAYINDVLITSCTDVTYPSGGAPGYAHWWHPTAGAGTSLPSDFSITRFDASDRSFW